MTTQEIVAMKASIEVQLDEYARDIDAYAVWLSGWRKRQSGFRCKRQAGSAA